jgi:hypothetical protein
MPSPESPRPPPHPTSLAHTAPVYSLSYPTPLSRVNLSDIRQYRAFPSHTLLRSLQTSPFFSPRYPRNSFSSRPFYFFTPSSSQPSLITISSTIILLPFAKFCFASLGFASSTPFLASHSLGPPRTKFNNLNHRGFWASGEKKMKNQERSVFFGWHEHILLFSVLHLAFHFSSHLRSFIFSLPL